MMWIMLIECLPIKDPPPKYAIFWSTPWPMDDQIENFINTAKWNGQLPSDEHDGEADFESIEDPDFHYIYTPLGKDPNPALARQIIYNDQAIRIFRHEFSIMTDEKMERFVGNQDASHTLVHFNVAGEKLIDILTESDYKNVYESALLDGATPNIAQLIALGHDFGTYPPIGYYVLREEYARFLP